ncbi:FMN-dependent NADH-azoreductase [Nocardia asteroides]|uniref:FMN-dependent NADH-azoreductase n=1 Tax=Nocardia asteroides TaxID=1824 RepID=UPI001E315190|nr:NAD(P)H-dependent oxidoreductase [Nocardia asteroides]UGT53010.1 NAD(P)H-dependent oxidoreductase [Nocardia asteroides]
MTHLLHLDASARTTSVSRRLGAEFVRAWQAAAPEGEYTYRDLSAEPTPFIGAGWTELCDAVLAAGATDLDRLPELATTPAAKEAWRIVEPLLAQLLAADVILIGTPMYNYSIPAALKAWLDQVTFPRMSLGHRRFVVVSARGGAYSPGAPKAAFDYQERYLRDFFAGHFAVTDTVFVHAELANAVQDPNLAHLRAEYESSLAAALTEVATLAKDYVR